MVSKSKAIEDIYQKKSQIEHILIRPDTYIGSTSVDIQQMWVWDDTQGAIVKKNLAFCPGLYKIFDEILVNAADNKQRDPKMTTIKIDIDRVKNSITVFNDGKGIPIVIHKEEKIYVPSLIFGHLLTSSNFDDEERKVTGGRNGFGAKLCNIFSHKFILETASKEQKKKFIQFWENNMGKTTEPSIKDYTGSDFTRVTFEPDLTRFNMKELDEDFVALLKKRAYDLAGTTPNIKVYLNDQLIEINSFEKYAALYSRSDIDNSENITTLYSKVNDRWEVCVLPSDGSFQHVSFVNSISTAKGGSHVNHVCNKIVARLIEDAQKKIKNTKVILRAQNVKQHLWLFINAKIENPSFDSQTKENLTLNEKEFGSSCEFPDKFLKKVSDLLTENIVSWYNLKLKNELNKKGATVKRSKLHGIAKLDDANDAGTSKSSSCVLILTEGDSAKSLAVAGVTVVGRDKYGVFPLRGKVLNIRETATTNVLKNKEIEALVKIIGLDFKKKYDSPESMSTLRYGKVMFMTDQDFDGSHIKGLLINFFHYLWPDLLKNNFLEQFITPIVKVSKGKNVKAFFSIPEYEEWQKETPDHKSWKVKYYKGLGTSKDIEVKEYFENLPRHRIPFKYSGDPCNDAIVMAFSKKLADARKNWLDSYQSEQARRKEFGLPPVYLYQKDTTQVSYCDFVNKELILFSHADNIRSIPNMVDGLKPVQRKVLFASFKRKIKDIKVLQLAGIVSELTSYHHGEQSLTSTIVNLAQNYVGSNNINLLMPNGQFGTRIRGGKDCAAPRYIFTELNILTRAIFLPADDCLLNYLYDDNQMIEPDWYAPIIPMILVNGAEGIGTGYSTKIPNYNPREIIENILRLLNNEEPERMQPFYKNFTGIIRQVANDKYLVSGRAHHAGKDTVVIDELPIRVWTQTYRELVLEKLVRTDSKNDNYALIDYKDYHDVDTINYVLQFRPNYLESLDDAKLTHLLKLQSVILTTQFVLFDSSGKLHRYATELDILKDFFNVRLKKYVERKAYLEALLSAELSKLSNQERFISEKVNNKIVIENRKKAEMINILKVQKYDSDPVKAFQRVHSIKISEQVSEETEASVENDDYEYLLGMPLWSLTYERIESLRETKNKKEAELNQIKSKTPHQLWKDDLENLMKMMDDVEEQEIKERNKMKKKTNIKKIKTPIKSREVDCTQYDPKKSLKIMITENGDGGEAIEQGEEISAEKPAEVKSTTGGTKRKKASGDNAPPKSKRAPAKEKKPVATKKADEKKSKTTSMSKKVTVKEDISDISKELDEESPIKRTLTKRTAAVKPKKYIDSFNDEDIPSDDDDIFALSD